MSLHPALAFIFCVFLGHDQVNITVILAIPTSQSFASHCETRRVVIDDEKGMNAQISTDIVVFRALRNFRRFQWEKIPPITVDIYNKINCHGIQHKMV